MEQQTGLKLGKEYIKALLIQLICRVHYMKCQAGWITIWNPDYQEKYQQPQICRWYHSNGRKQRGTKSLFDDSEKTGLKLNIQKTKIMASSLITFMANRRGKSGNSDRFYFLGVQITANVDCSQESERYSFLGRKAMTNLNSIFKSWDFADIGPYTQSYGFSSSPVWM